MGLREAPDPVISASDEVLVRVAAVGICGSDMHYFTEGRIGDQVVKFPYTIGHECAGTVVEVGPAVKRVRPGDRVAIEPALTCGQCDQCRAGRSNTCRTCRFLGCPGQIEGALCEFLVMPEHNCFPLSDDLSFAHGAFSEPLAIGLYAARLTGLPEDAAIGILGTGPIGLVVELALADAGHRRIYGTDKIDARLEAARDLGAGWTGNPDREDIVREIFRQEPLGLDVVFDCCGKQEALDQATELLKPGGKLMAVGIPSVDRVSFKVDDFRRKELVVRNVRRQTECVEDALDLIRREKKKVDRLLTHRFSFVKTREAFELVEAYADGVIKAVVEI